MAIRHGDAWGTVNVDVQTASTGFAAEVRFLLLSHGGTPEGRRIAIGELDFRLCAAELGVILQRHDAEAVYDSVIQSLLASHIEELRARKDAERMVVLSKSAVLRRLKGTRFKRHLTSKQIRNLTRLLVLRHAADFSVPGAGKTATLLALYETLHEARHVDRLLVVAPKNAFLAWEDEIVLCFGEDVVRVKRLEGGYDRASAILAEDPEVCLLTYQFLPNVRAIVAEWISQHRTHIVLDESHRIKAGEGGILASAAIALGGTGVRRDVLTGTPMPQSPEDLRPQMQFLWPGQRIMPEYRADAEASDEILLDLQRRVRPLYVRTTKKELSLPEIRILPVPVELGPVQRELYELLRSEAKRIASGMPSQDRAYFRMLGRHVMRLLEAASNPMLLTGESLFDDEDQVGRTPQAAQAFDLLREFSRYEKPAKVQEAIRRTRDALATGGQPKVLIWTSFVRNILLLEKLLAEYSPVILYGAIGTGEEEDPDTREGRIRRFHSDPTCRVMIANPAACGEGISLHQACHYAIYLDRTFNAAHYLQSLDRIHRLGLPRNQVVHVDVLEARWTIDSRVARRLRAKTNAMSRILNDPGLAALAYDPADVVEEFPAGLEREDAKEVIGHLIEEDRGR